MERLYLRGQKPCKFIGTKKTVHIRTCSHNLGKIENAVLVLQLDLQSTRIHHENGGFQKHS